MLSLLSAGLMMWAARLEQWLPSRPAVAMMLRFKNGFMADESLLAKFAHDRGYELAGGSLQVQLVEGRQEWRCVAIAKDKKKGIRVSGIAKDLSRLEGVEAFQVAHARN
jgi:putative Mg2+ transporter-C (MgtC) family protein